MRLNWWFRPVFGIASTGRDQRKWPKPPLWRGPGSTAFFYRPKKRAIGYCTIGPGTLVHMPEAALAIIPGAHVFRALRDYALAFGTRQRRLESGDDTRGDVVLHCEDVGQISVVTLG